MKNLILILAILFSVNGNAQRGIDHEKLIGFGCYYGGTSSEVVLDMGSILNAKMYPVVIEKLESDNPAERFLAVIIAERLSDLGKYQLTETDKKLIAAAYSSSDLVSVCSGCTYFDTIELRVLLKDTTSNSMLKRAKDWVNRYLE